MRVDSNVSISIYFCVSINGQIHSIRSIPRLRDWKKVGRKRLR